MKILPGLGPVDEQLTTSYLTIAHDNEITTIHNTMICNYLSKTRRKMKRVMHVGIDFHSKRQLQ